MSTFSHRPVSRRRFLTGAAGAAAAPLIVSLPSPVLGRVLNANDSIRLGWIGVGGRGSSLLREALDSVSVSNLRVTAICDLDEGRRNAAIKSCGAMNPAGIEDYRKLLEREDVDAVFIATPIHLHREHAVAAMEAGKHAYCEKPLGPTSGDVKAIHDAVKKARKKFQVGFQWRYHAGFLALVEAVQGGKIGKVHWVSGERHVGGYPTSGWYVNRDLSGDLIVEQAVHEMNVFCWMLQSHPERACGFGGINALKGVPPERTIMDHYAVTYEFPGDITLSYSHCVYAPSGFGGLHTTLYGSDGRAARLEGTTRLLLTQGDEAKEVELPPLQDATQLAIQAFIRSIRDDTEPLANVDAGCFATLMAILGRTAIHGKRAAEWKEVAL
jgi:predicted dehydrogenase